MNFLLLALMVVSTLSVSNSGDTVQISCEDAVNFANQYIADIQETNESLKNQIVLAQQAMDPSLSDAQRSQLNGVFRQTTDVITYLFQNANFEDSLLRNFLYFEKGFDFKIPLKLANGNTYWKSFDFSVLNEKTIGAYAHVTFHPNVDFLIHNIDTLDIGVNEGQFDMKVEDSDLSTNYRDVSAIAFVAAFNRVEDVHAIALPTVLKLGQVNSDYLAQTGLLTNDLFVINNFSIIGDVREGADALVKLINSYTSVTGVVAEKVAPNEVDLTAMDGQNVVVTSIYQNFLKSAFGMDQKEIVAIGDVEVIAPKYIIVYSQSGSVFTNEEYLGSVDPYTAYMNQIILDPLSAEETLTGLKYSRNKLRQRIIKANEILQLCQ